MKTSIKIRYLHILQNSKHHAKERTRQIFLNICIYILQLTIVISFLFILLIAKCGPETRRIS